MIINYTDIFDSVIGIQMDEVTVYELSQQKAVFYFKNGTKFEFYPKEEVKGVFND